MARSPSEPEEYHEPRPLPCPNCGGTNFSRLGTFRSQCVGCNSTFSNAELAIPNQEPQ